MKFRGLVFLGLFLSAAFVVCSTTTTTETSQQDQTTSDSEEETTNLVVDEDAKYYKCKHRCCNPYKGCWCCSASEADDQLEGSQVKSTLDNVEENTNDKVEDASSYYKCKHRCCHRRIGCRCCSAAEAHQPMEGSYSGTGIGGEVGAGNEDHNPKQIEN